MRCLAILKLCKMITILKAFGGSKVSYNIENFHACYGYISEDYRGSG
jgi:hypothetical protein